MGRHSGPRVAGDTLTPDAPPAAHPRHARPHVAAPPAEAPHVEAPPVAAPVLWETAAWSAFAAGVLWVVILTSGRGVRSASAWAGSLLGLVLAALALVGLTRRRHSTPPGPDSAEY
jgi:MYXO-CTERM domain-containing protein